jgi:hypothetical protein
VGLERKEYKVELKAKSLKEGELRVAAVATEGVGEEGNLGWALSEQEAKSMADGSCCLTAVCLKQKLCIKHPWENLDRLVVAREVGETIQEHFVGTKPNWRQRGKTVAPAVWERVKGLRHFPPFQKFFS